jgi:hypothetical protein
MALLVPTILDGAVRIEALSDVRIARRALAAFVLIGLLIWTQHLAFGSGVVHAWVGPAVLLGWLWVQARPGGSRGGPS